MLSFLIPGQNESDNLKLRKLWTQDIPMLKNVPIRCFSTTIYVYLILILCPTTIIKWITYFLTMFQNQRNADLT